MLACLASQYAGRSLSASKEETGGKSSSRSARVRRAALACKEPLYEELRYRDEARSRLPRARSGPRAARRRDREDPARRCRCDLADLTLILTPTASRAGTTQVVGRALEVALHKAHVLGFPLADIVEGTASAPLPPPGCEAIDAMGRTNDAILYGGRVHLTVTGADDAARDLARRLPSSAVARFRPLVRRHLQGIRLRLLPNRSGVVRAGRSGVSNLTTGRTFHAGATRFDLLHPLWLDEALT